MRRILGASDRSRKKYLTSKSFSCLIEIFLAFLSTIATRERENAL